MNRSSNPVMAILLIACGVIILLSLFGWEGLMSWLIPLAMVGLGIYGIRSGRSTAGWIVFVLGLVFLLGKMWGIFALIVSIAFIWIGWSLLSRKRMFP